MDGKRVTIIDIAKEAGVSKSTVSLVLQASPLVHEETRTRVTGAIAKLGYVYNRGAANLRSSDSRIIGIIVNDLTNSFFAELAVGMDRVVQSSGYVQFLANSAENVDRQRQIIASMREHGIAGLILSPAHGTEPSDLRAIIESGLPVLLVVRNVPGTKASSLLSENQLGASAAVRHLLDLGHRRIAFVGGFADTHVFSERLEGYRVALNEAGIAFDPDLIVNSSPSRAGGAGAVTSVLTRRGDIPTAALCLNDAVAFGVCDGLRARRLEPGRDFSVVGFDDVIEARTAVPALTTVSVDPQGMGERAAQMLLRQINAGTHVSETIRSSVRLVVRQSSATPAERVHRESVA